MAGRHASSSFKILRQTVPEGYTFGWNRGGVNLPAEIYRVSAIHRDSDDGKKGDTRSRVSQQPMVTVANTYILEAWLGILEAQRTSVSVRGSSHGMRSHLPSGKVTSSLKTPPSHRVSFFPGTAHSQRFRSRVPSGVLWGFATKPKGWSRRHCLL